MWWSHLRCQPWPRKAGTVRHAGAASGRRGGSPCSEEPPSFLLPTHTQVRASDAREVFISVTTVCIVSGLSSHFLLS